MRCRAGACTVQIQHRKHILDGDNAEHTAPARPYELDYTDEEYICPEDLDHEL